MLAASCWGVADFIAGLKSRSLSAILVLLVQQAAGALIVVAAVVAAGEALPGREAALLSVAAGAAGAIALGAFYRALAIGTMSVVAPISASGVTLPVAVGLATGDRPSSLQAVGLALTVVGVVLASREAQHEGESNGPSRASIGLALVAAAGFGAFFTLSDGAADDSVLWLLVISRTTAVVLLLGVLAATRGAGLERLPVRTLGVLALVGVLDLAATGLYALANTHGALSIVAVVGSLYPVLTVLLARVVLKERLQPVQSAGVAVAFFGVAAVVGGSA